MKPSERYFKFPIKLYGESDMDEEDRINDIIGKPSRKKPKFVVGHARVKALDILSWNDEFSAHRSIQSVKEDGFNLTEVITKHDDYLCTWTREKFEEEFDAHVKELGITI